MYNIYHLMRRRGQASSRVGAVVRFMIHLYQGDELVRTTTYIAEEAVKLAPEQRQEHFLAYETILAMTPEPALKSRIIEETARIFSALPDAPASVRQLMASLQTDKPTVSTVLTEEKLTAVSTTLTEEEKLTKGSVPRFSNRLDN